LYQWFIEPKARLEDDSRREFILNVLLTSTFCLITALAGTVFVVYSMNPGEYRGASIGFVVVLIVLAGLLGISRAGHFATAAGFLIAFLSLAVFYTNMSRGVDLPMTWMFYALLVYMAGIIIGSRTAFIYTLFVSISFSVLTWLHDQGIKPLFIEDWKTDSLNLSDAIGFSFSLSVILVVSWLSSREIYRSLARARRSELELKAERDSLEMKVEQRTRELKEAQREHVEQLEQFADFGRLASGILHDLANPLTSMGLNLRMAQSADPETQASLLSRALVATERMETLVRAARNQVRSQAEPYEFSIADEIEQATELLAYKARKADVHFNLDEVENIRVIGNPYAFSRSVCNLITNAIEAYNNPEADEFRIVRISASANQDLALVTVEDRGVGIPPEVMSRIFEPLVTTKSASGGSGMGLATVKSIIERDFGGEIQVESKPGEGSRFTIRFPIKRRAV
jgi:signal transduction histidine kinase